MKSKEILIQEVSRIAEVNHLSLSESGLAPYVIAMGLCRLAKGRGRLLVRHGTITGRVKGKIGLHSHSFFLEDNC